MGRNASELEPELANRADLISKEYAKRYPLDPQPFFTQCFRSMEDQTLDYAKGRTADGKVVTNAKAGESLHNYTPSYAYDIAFKDATGIVHWEISLFERYAAIAHEYGLEWGGDWHTFKDLPHFQPRGYIYHMAQFHTEIIWSVLPVQEA